MVETERLIRISEAVHALANKEKEIGDILIQTASFLLDEAKCDCEQCKERRT